MRRYAFTLRYATFNDTLRKMTAHSAMIHSGSLSSVLDAAERTGKLNLRTEEIRVALPGVTPTALRQALYRQQRRGRLLRLSRGADHWLIVPLQHAVVGAPPLEAWLDRYLSKTLHTPYYVALLSAAETYGASPYAVMVTQVMVPDPRRPITVGRHEIAFYTHAQIERVPTRWHETPNGRFRVGTAEWTALELVQRSALLGGMVRVQEVLHVLWGACSPSGLSEALNAFQETPTTQRLGTLLAMDGQEALAAVVANWLHGRRKRIVPLEGEIVASAPVDATFKVRLPPDLRSANT